MATAKFEGLNVPAFLAWVEALESGEIEQGRTALHQENHGVSFMCCLGVLSSQTASACGIEVQRFGRGDGYVDVRYDGQGGYLPRKVAEYLGIPSSHIDPKPGDTCSILVTLDEEAVSILDHTHGVGKQMSVANLNDSNMFRFTDIARLLRKEFLNA